MDLLGQPADRLLAAGVFTGEFFILDKSGWRLMTREEFKKKHKEEPETDKSVCLSFKEKLDKKRLLDEQDELELQDKIVLGHGFW